MHLERLSVRAFRNLSSIDITFGPRFNVVAGDNGQGKTNLLESVYVLGTSRSFRSSKILDVVAFNDELASVRGHFLDASETRYQSVGVKAGARVVRIDEKRPPSLAAYAVRSPMVVFHPGEIVLSQGPSSERRRLLDRIALYLAPGSMADLEAYTKAVRSRAKTLELRGVNARDLEDWEALCVKHGLAVMEHRARAAELLAARATVSFSKIAAPDLALSVSYQAGAPRSEAGFAEALKQKRPIDVRRGSATIGPHRDELALSINEHLVRGVASQGQHRAVTLALKSAEIDVIEDARGVRPILLLDDVSSELDRARTTALFAFLREQEGQVLLTTTRPELIDTGATAARSDFVIAGGRISS